MADRGKVVNHFGTMNLANDISKNSLKEGKVSV